MFALLPEPYAVVKTEMAAFRSVSRRENPCTSFESAPPSAGVFKNGQYFVSSFSPTGLLKPRVRASRDLAAQFYMNL